jgi:hypothetical protein
MAVNADELTLSILDDASQTAITVPADGSVNLRILGSLDGAGTNDGLALFGVNLMSIGDPVTLSTALDLNSVAGTASFDRNDGLTNPPGPPSDTGFGGTASGDDLLQIGGGQNTINNDSTSPPLFPVGDVVLQVAQPGPDILAEGIFNCPAEGVYVLQLQTGFANVIDDGQGGPTYDVTPATVGFGNQTYTVTCQSTSEPDMWFAQDGIKSVGYHGGAVADYIELAINSNGDNYEPRSLSSTELFLEVGFNEDVTGVSLAITNGGSPVLTDAVPTINGSVVTVTFPTDPTNALCYTFDFDGTTWAGGAMDSSLNDTAFNLVFLKGDVNQDGSVSAGDKNSIIAVGTWNTDADVAVNGPTCDLNRDGSVSAGDKNTVTAPGTWNSTAETCP